MKKWGCVALAVVVSACLIGVILKAPTKEPIRIVSPDPPAEPTAPPVVESPVAKPPELRPEKSKLEALWEEAGSVLLFKEDSDNWEWEVVPDESDLPAKAWATLLVEVPVGTKVFLPLPGKRDPQTISVGFEGYPAQEFIGDGSGWAMYVVGLTPPKPLKEMNSDPGSLLGIVKGYKLAYKEKGSGTLKITVGVKEEWATPAQLKGFLPKLIGK